jgi:hypothetical protein
MEGKRSVFACALVFSPVRMAGQTACPEESLARARKRCEGGGEQDYFKFEIGNLRFEISDLGAAEVAGELEI